jgi:hypothetical protein
MINAKKLRRFFLFLASELLLLLVEGNNIRENL